MSRRGRVRAVGVGVVVVGAALTQALGVGVPGAAAAKTPTVKVKITSGGCPAKVKAKAGPTTFAVHNDGAANVTEFEVMNGNRIVGEVENVAAGLTRDFTLTLKAGEYTTYCPNGDDRERGLLKVSGANAAPDPDAAAAVATYRTYLQDQAAQLVALTTTFVDAVKAGDLDAAKAAYGPARVPYERIEPVAETFGDLDPRIDAREGDVPKSEWGGFHVIEQALFAPGTTAGMAPVADQLLEDVEQLAGLIPDVEIEPAQIANGAVELLNEVSASKITGEEERYSRIDLLDFEGNVQGSQAAFAAVRPMLEQRNPALATEIDAKFAAVFTALEPYRQGGGFVPYTALTNADTKALAQVIDTLAEPLSKVARLVASNR